MSMDDRVESGHERIMELVCLLLRAILASPRAYCHGNRLIANLRKRGYEKSEIDAAMELVFKVPEVINFTFGYRTDMIDPSARLARVFSVAEKEKLDLSVRGRLLQYRALGMLSESECEDVLTHLLSMETPKIGLVDLYLVLSQIIQDRERVMMLAPDLVRPIAAAIN